VPETTPQEMEEAVANCKEAFEEWKNHPAHRRARIMFAYRDLLLERQEDLARLVVAELGKTFADAKGGVWRGIEMLEFASGIPSQMLGNTLAGISENMDLQSIRQPLGVTASITPFNFPVMVPLWFFPIAIATGNTHIIKPSPVDPMSAVACAQMGLEVGLPGGVLNVIHGRIPPVDFLCTHEDISAISFVGGNVAGEYIGEKAMQHGKRVQSNMGAKNHGVVMPDSNKNQAINALVGAGFGAAGQRCMALSTGVLVGEAVDWRYDIAEAASEYRPGHGHDPEADFGPVVSQAALDKIEALIASAEKDGCEILLDGRNCVVKGYENGYFLGPTVIAGVEAWMEVYTTEVFGPVLLLMQADSLDDSLNIIAENPFGNGASIFTRSGAAARKFQTEVECGQVGINVPIPVPVPPFSFTGSRKSFLGDTNAYGAAGVNFFTQLKTKST